MKENFEFTFDQNVLVTVGHEPERDGSGVYGRVPVPVAHKVTSRIITRSHFILLFRRNFAQTFRIVPGIHIDHLYRRYISNMITFIPNSIICTKPKLQNLINGLFKTSTRLIYRMINRWWLDLLTRYAILDVIKFGS